MRVPPGAERYGSGRWQRSGTGWQIVVHVVGPGGIGKSALLRAAARRAAERDVATVWVDGRDVPPFPAEIEAALAPVREAEAAAFVVFDSYELIAALDGYLRERLIPDAHLRE